MTKFGTNKLYTTRLIGDHKLIVACFTVSRTEKTVKAVIDGKTSNYRLSVHDNEERFYPFGRYSMAPVVRASSLRIRLASRRQEK